MISNYKVGSYLLDNKKELFVITSINIINDTISTVGITRIKVPTYNTTVVSIEGSIVSLTSRNYFQVVPEQDVELTELLYK